MEIGRSENGRPAQDACLADGKQYLTRVCMTLCRGGMIGNGAASHIEW